MRAERARPKGRSEEGPLTKSSSRTPDAPIGAPSPWLSLVRLRPRRAGLCFTREERFFDLPSAGRPGEKAAAAELIDGLAESLIVDPQLCSEFDPGQRLWSRSQGVEEPLGQRRCGLGGSRLAFGVLGDDLEVGR